MHAHCWEPRPEADTLIVVHLNCSKCCSCKDHRSGITTGFNCGRCHIHLFGDMAVHKVWIRIGEGFNQTVTLCFDCRATLRKGVNEALAPEKPVPEEDEPRSITIQEG